MDQLAAALGIRLALPSRTFFDLANGIDLHKDIAKRVRDGDIFVLWVRHHWVATKLMGNDWYILDSASSRPVTRSIINIARRLSWPTPTFLPVWQQHYGSQECGLFALLYAFALTRLHPLAIAAVASKHPQRAKLNLGHLRSLLSVNSVSTFVSSAMALTGLDGFQSSDSPSHALHSYASTQKCDTAPAQPSAIRGSGRITQQEDKTNHYGDKLERFRELPRAPSVTRDKSHMLKTTSSWTHNPYRTNKTLHRPEGLSKPQPEDISAGRAEEPKHAETGGTTNTTVPTPRRQQISTENNPPTTTIDVDSDYEEMLTHTPLLWSDMQLVDTRYRDAIQSLFEQSAVEMNKSIERAQAEIEREFRSLSASEKRRRAHEYDRRRRVIHYTVDNASLQLKNCTLQHGEIWQALRRVAVEVKERNYKRAAEAELRDTFEHAATPGIFISSKIICRALQDATRIFPTWVLLDPVSFADYAYQRVEHTAIALNNGVTNFAVVIHDDDHYVLASFQARQRQSTVTLQLRDSLNRSPRPSLTVLLRRLRDLLSSHGIQSHEEIQRIPVPQQKTNDCAIDAVNNLASIMSGNRGNLSRDLIRAIADTSEPLIGQHAAPLWLSIWPVPISNEATHGSNVEVQERHESAPDNAKRAPSHVKPGDKARDTVSCNTNTRRVDRAVRCRNGHVMSVLTHMPRGTASFECDACGKEIQSLKNEPVTRCPVCNFDLCTACSASRSLESSETHNQVQEASAEQIEAVLRDSRNKDRLTVSWSHRGSHEAPTEAITWIGTITKEWSEKDKCVQVTWDAGLDRLSGTRTRPFPPAQLPDPRLCFGAPTISRPFIEDTSRGTTEEIQGPTTTNTTVAAMNPSRIMTRSALQAACRQATLDNSLVRVTIGPSAIRIAERPDTNNQSKDEWKESCTRTCLGHVISEGRDYVYAICAEQCKICGAWTSEEEDGLEEEKEELLVNLLDPDFTCRGFQIIQDTPQVRSTCTCHETNKDEISNSENHAKADITPLENGTEFKAFRVETQPDASLGFAASAPYPADIAKAWYIFSGRPPHIQSIVWKQLAESTRATHARWLRKLRTVPATWAKAPLGSAIVQLILTEATRARWTSWATIACALSSFASALKRLPEYTNAMNSIDLSKDSVFSSALKRALQLARVTKRHSSQEALTPAQFDQLYRHIKDEEVRLLLAITWFFAGRVGDMRQVIAGDVEVGDDITCASEVKNHVTITFRAGKGAAFWGPYSIQSIVPQHVAKALSAIKLRRGINCRLFSELHQSHLSRIFNDLFKESGGLRSIRRGRLISLALQGVSDDHLKLLSGHKRMDTLMRYLGWGRHSSDAREAALARENLVLGAGALEPPKMGPWSGLGGKRGKRIHRPPPDLWPRRPPKARDLGIEPQKETTQSWPLKAKPSIGLDFHGIQSLIYEERDGSQTTELREKLRMVTEWCSGRTLQTELGNRRAYEPNEIPVSHISRQDFDTLMGANKLALLEEGEEIRGWAAGYLIPQVKKKQRRPVWEGQINQESLWLPNVTYPARRVRRMLRGYAYTADFDFEGWFDQFHLENLAQLYHVVRYSVTEKDGSRTEVVTKLTRLPMGDRQAPGIAQYVTDILIAPFLHMENVKVFSMIDNIRIAARDRHTFMIAVKTFVARCKTAGATLNPLEWPVANSTTTDPADSQLHETNVGDMNDELWEAYGKADGKVFLGEQYITSEHGEQGTRNTPKNVDKLREALSLANRAKEDTRGYTHRNIVSLIGLMLWMCHTLDIHLCNLRDILDSYAKISQRAIYAGWDSDLKYVDSRLLQKINALGDTLCKNEITALPPQPSEPSNRNEDYDVVIITDACETGWAAFVHLVASGKTQLIKQRWAPHQKNFHLSTISEPAAASMALDWVREQLGPNVRIALITDHSPIVQGQPRWWNQQGGFSVNPWLNECYRRMVELHVQAFHIRGDQNPADAPSRDTLTARYNTISVTEILGHWVSAPLSQLEHPFIAPRETFKWQG